jgi:chromate transporter
MPSTPPSLIALFSGFVSIGIASFGGGLTAWVRREVVQRRGWLDDQQFLSGYALSQLVPGATNVNLAVFIGTQLRGAPGAVACFAGLTAPPLLIVLILGAVYFGMRGLPGGTFLSIALSGMGAVAIGLNLGTGIRLALTGIRRVVPALIAATVAVSIGVLGVPLVKVLAVMIPVSLAAAWWSPAPRTRAHGHRSSGTRSSEKPPSDPPPSDPPPSDRPPSDPPPSDRPTSDRPPSDRPQLDRPQLDRPRGNQPP